MHFTDLFKTVNMKNDSSNKLLPNHSHASLNSRSKIRIPNPPNRDRELYHEIVEGHTVDNQILLGRTKRMEFGSYMDQRNQHEETVNNALISGLLLRKNDRNKSDPLLNFAYENRKKAQEAQCKMDEIKFAGHNDWKKAEIASRSNAQ